MKNSSPTMYDDIQNMIAANDTVHVPDTLSVFTGHFPGEPVVPGIYSLELAICHVARQVGHELCLQEIIRCKFHKPIVPGMNLQIQSNLLQQNTDSWVAKVTIKDLQSNESKPVASIKLHCVVADKRKIF